MMLVDKNLYFFPETIHERTYSRGLTYTRINPYHSDYNFMCMYAQISHLIAVFLCNLM